MKKFAILFTAAIMLFSFTGASYGAESINCWFPPGWRSKGKQAKAITAALTKNAGIVVKPRIAKSYPQILKAFSSGEPSLVYVGSFVQAIIYARGLGTPLVQNINGKDLYSGIMIYPKGKDPESILRDDPEKIAYTVGASSGESSAKAATSGKAAIGVASHGAAAGAVRVGKAKAAIVKNWWWEKNKQKFPMLTVYKVPGVSIEKNPDNVLSANKTLPPQLVRKITDAAIAAKAAFGAPVMVPFDTERIQFSLELMKKGKIDPLRYEW